MRALKAGRHARRALPIRAYQTLRRWAHRAERKRLGLVEAAYHPVGQDALLLWITGAAFAIGNLLLLLGQLFT